MSPFFWNWTLILSGAALILLEVSLGGFAGFDLVLIGSAFAVGGGAGLLFDSAHVGLTAGGALCAAYILGGRRLVRARIMGPAKASGPDLLIGVRGLVLARIAPHAAGRVRVKGEEWRALPARENGPPIEEGAEVTVDGVDGVTLLVR